MYICVFYASKPTSLQQPRLLFQSAWRSRDLACSRSRRGLSTLPPHTTHTNSRENKNSVGIDKNEWWKLGCVGACAVCVCVWCEGWKGSGVNPGVGGIGHTVLFSPGIYCDLLMWEKHEGPAVCSRPRSP